MLKSEYLLQVWTNGNKQKQDTEALLSTNPEGLQVHTISINKKDL